MSQPSQPQPPDLQTLLDFTVQGFRCFRDASHFSDTRKVNVVAGENNSGKSTLLVPLRRLTTIHHKLAIPYHGAGHFAGDAISDLRFEPGDIAHGCSEFTVTFNNQEFGGVLTGMRGRVSGKTRSQSVRFSPNEKKPSFTTTIVHAGANIVFVPPRRRITSLLHTSDLSDPGEGRFDGEAVLPMVLDWTNPGAEEGSAVALANDRLRHLEEVVGRLLGTAARVRALPGVRDIEIELHGRAIPLSRLGTGVEQALILSVVLTQFPQALLLIEEPENFLHPTVQRRLLHELMSRAAPTVLTTHSNHILDVRHDDVAYFRTFRGTDGSSHVEPFRSNRRYQALWDLGVRPSSLFESNVLIWVEGPSDAIYLRHWLQMHDDSRGLTEGVHYSFAYHSGSLLRSFYADWDGSSQLNADALVDLCSIHPNFFLVADRDAEGSDLGHGYLGSLLQDSRLSEVAWVTDGKEIENYVPLRLVEEYLTCQANPRQEIAVRPVHQDVKAKPIWEVMNLIAGKHHRKGYPDKVDLAQWIAARLLAGDLETLDLNDQIRRLIAFIRRASGVDQSPPSENHT